MKVDFNNNGKADLNLDLKTVILIVGGIISLTMTYSNLIAKLGLRQQGFLVDVLWHEENEDWKEFEVNVYGEGCHQFKGYKYADS